MICEISDWESEGGRLYPVMMRDAFKSVVHSKKPFKRPFFYSSDISEVMQGNFIVKDRKVSDNRSAVNRILPTVVGNKR